MFKARKRFIVLLIASALAASAGFAASEIAGLTTDKANTDATRTSEVQQPVPEALLPPVAVGPASYRM